MTLRQLELLVGIVDHGSISSCAEAFGISQPAVTNQIQQLESELGTLLLVRKTRGATLTSYGEIAVSQAKKVLGAAKQISIDAQHAKESVFGTITLGVSPISPVSVYHFPRIYRSFHDAYPDVHVAIVEMEALYLADQVVNHRVDLALTPLPLFTTKARYEELWLEELVVISDTEALGDSVSMGSLRQKPFVFMRSGFSVRVTALRMAQQAGFEPQIVAEAQTLHSLVGIVAAGIGIAIVPLSSVTLEAQGGLIHITHLNPHAYRRLAMVYRANDNLSPVLPVLMNHIRTYAKKISSDTAASS